MNFKKILVPFDKSDPAKKALEQAVVFAKEDGQVIVDVIYVTAPPDITRTTSYSSNMYNSDSVIINANDILDERNMLLEREAENVKELTKDIVADVVDRVNFAVIPGMSAVDDIVEYCTEAKSDLIIMGCRGLGALRGMLGSVSYGVLRSAPVPVLIMK